MRAHWRSTAGFVVVYVAAMVLGRAFTLESTGLALFWPAAGVAAAWMIRDTTRSRVVVDSALLVVVTAVFFGVVVGIDPVASTLLGAANAVQAIVVRAFMVRRSGGASNRAREPAVMDAATVRRLALAALAAALAGAPIGTLASWSETGDVSWSTALNWFLRNACGILLPAAAAWAWTDAWRRSGGPLWRRPWTSAPRRGAVLELGAVVILSLGIGAVVIAAPAQIPLTYPLIAVSAWVGFRFLPAIGAAYTFVFGTVAILLTLAGSGPFGGIEDLARRANAIQLLVTLTMLLVLLVACGVSQRVELTAQLRESQVRATGRADLLGAITDSIVDGLCVSDSWGHVLLANPAAAELGGSDEHGAHVHEADTAQWFWPDGTQIEDHDLPHACALRGEVVALSDVVRRDLTTGHERVLAVSAVPLNHGANDGDIAEARPLAVVLMRDVTRQRAQQRAQENFVAVVAHDLKGPVAGVLSWAEMAREQLAPAAETPHAHTGTEAASASLERIERTASRMSVLITDLLDYTVAGSANLLVRHVDLDDVVDSIVMDLERPDHEAIVTHTALGVVVTDELLTRQLFANLIGNAIKYVAPGVTPQIHIESHPVASDLEIRVSDNGVGIPEDDRGRVFDTFYRSDGTSAVPGSGLGLAICRTAVERHGGWIAAREGPGGTGTTIAFTLPQPESAADIFEPSAHTESTTSVPSAGAASGTGIAPDAPS